MARQRAVDYDAKRAAIRDAAAKAECDIVLIGGYSQHPLLAPKSALDELLRLTAVPVMICR